jgi:hypothetical protein
MDERQAAYFRATAGGVQDFGATPQDALNSLLKRLSGDALTPIVIWPFNRGDAFFSEAQQQRLQELKSRRDTLSEAEQQEWEHLVEASFDSTISRTQALPIVKS